MKIGVVELSALAIDTSIYLSAKSDNQNPPKTLIITIKSNFFNILFSDRGFIHNVNSFLANPHIANAIIPKNNLMKVACMDGTSLIATFARITDIVVQIIDNNAYLIPFFLFLTIELILILSFSTHATPIDVIRIPVQDSKDGRSFNITKELIAIETGINVPISDDILGPKNIKDLKKKVSASVIPSNPLTARKIKSVRSI